MWIYVTLAVGSSILAGAIWSLFVRHVALGDSLATGVGSITYTGYVPRLIWWMMRRLHRPLLSSNFGKFGQTSTDLLTSLREQEKVRQAVARADFITLDIGGNDLRACSYQEECLEEKIAEFKENWTAILREIRLLNPDAPLFTMTIFDPVPLGDIRRPAVEAYVSRANDVIINPMTLAEFGVSGVAMVHEAFRGHECQYTWYCKLGDIHPTDAGHAAIAAAMIAVIDPYFTRSTAVDTRPKN